MRRVQVRRGRYAHSRLGRRAQQEADVQTRAPGHQTVLAGVQLDATHDAAPVPGAVVADHAEVRTERQGRDQARNRMTRSYVLCGSFLAGQGGVAKEGPVDA